MYYKYTGCIAFLPLGSKLDVEQSPDENPSDPQFRGSPCSIKEMYTLASQVLLTFRTFLKRVNAAMVARLLGNDKDCHH